MKIFLICVGQKMPGWINLGYEEFARRLPTECRLQLVEVAPGKRGKNADIERILRDEGERMLKAVPSNTHVIALDVRGQQWNTENLSVQLEDWMSGGRDIALLVGGPEGLAPACVQKASTKWSLSALTLPHPLVRVVVAEQLYRAWSILRNHPYHRGG